jgi:hypothetical protein
MKKLASLALAVVLIALATATAQATQYPLYAGQDILIGTVEVTNDSDNLYVSFHLDDPWVLLETHVAVEQDCADIPQKNGNPTPGQFPYSGITDDTPSM